MERSEKELLKAAAKAQRDRAIDKAKREYQLAIAGIEAVERLKTQLDSTERKRGRTKGSFDESKLTGGILKVLANVGETFTLDDLEGQMSEGETVNRKSLATAIRRLADERRGIEVVEEGRGRRIAVYRKIAF